MDSFNLINNLFKFDIITTQLSELYLAWRQLTHAASCECRVWVEKFNLSNNKMVTFW